MRLLLLRACIVTLGTGAAAPGFAQDCGLLCQINGYLASDHMATGPGDASPPDGASKPQHRSHAAATRPQGAKPVVRAVMSTAPKAAARPVPPPPVPAKAVAAQPTIVRTGAAKPRVAATRPDVPARPEPARPEPRVVAETHPARHHPRAAVETANAAPAAPRHARPSPVRSAPTVTAAATIPGSAPAMPAGFQPFMSSAFH